MATDINTKLEAAMKALKDGLELARTKKLFNLKAYMIQHVKAPVGISAELLAEKLKATKAKAVVLAPAKRVFLLGGTVMEKCDAEGEKIFKSGVFTGHAGQMGDKIADAMIAGASFDAAVLKVKTTVLPIGQIQKSKSAIASALKAAEQEIALLVAEKALGKAGMSKLAGFIAGIREEVAKASVKAAVESVEKDAA